MTATASPGVLGARRLILLPGMDGSDAMFRRLIANAPADVTATAIAYPSGPANCYGDLLPSVRAQLPRDDDYWLLGWSFSGPLALMLAAEKPTRLRGVILAATFVRKPVPYLPTWMSALATPALFRFYPKMSQAKALLGGYGTPEVRRLLAEAHARAGLKALACRAREAMRVDARDALAACEVPILYLRATKDRVIPPSRTEDLRREKPTVAVVDIEGPHLALITNPGASWAAIDPFMRWPA